MRITSAIMSLKDGFPAVSDHSPRLRGHVVQHSGPLFRRGVFEAKAHDQPVLVALETRRAMGGQHVPLLGTEVHRGQRHDRCFFVIAVGRQCFVQRTEDAHELWTVGVTR